ncbi:MAG: ABC transporter permease [Actinomycetota bacterium]|nr:ABC transporter permease [Actinomycetota bacterium]
MPRPSQAGWGRVVGRIAQYALVVLITLSLNFAIPRLAPGSPIDYLVPSEQVSTVTPEQRELILAQFGLERPLAEQYWSYLAGIAQGDLGVSTQQGRPVVDMLLERLPWTLVLVGGAIALSLIVGAGAGFLAAARRGGRMEVGGLAFFMFLDSMPPFWIGMLLLVLFSGYLNLLPVFGALPLTNAAGGFGLTLDVAERLVLPLLTLTLVRAGWLFLVARSSLAGELSEDYILMAEAKGLPRRRVLLRHGVRNALLPLVTAVAVEAGTLVGGATVVETVFSYPGLGRLIYESVLNRDYTVLQGAFLLLAVGVIAANLLADLLYPLIDPRVRTEGAR